MVELALSSYPGLYALGPPQPGSAFGVYWPALLDQSMLEHTVHHHDGTTETSSRPRPRRQGRGGARRTVPGAVGVDTVERRAGRRLARRARACPLRRQGRRREPRCLGTPPGSRDWLTSTLTVDELRRLLPETRPLAISRHELPNLGAVNFVLRGLLGTGATSTLRLDAQAKALGEWLRSRSIKVRALVEAATGRSV